MKALWQREVQAILQRQDFVKWWESLVSLESKKEQIQARHQELLAQVNLMSFKAELTQKNAIDSLYLAGEYEDSAARHLAEAAEIENKSYEAVANFEGQRIEVSDLFSKMGAVEHRFLTRQAEAQSLRITMEGTKEKDKKAELKRHLKSKEKELSRTEKDLRESSAIYERENSRKMSLWEEVEQMWARSLDINMGVSERRIKSRQARRVAEVLFREAEDHKHKSEALQIEAETAKKKSDEVERAIDDQRSAARKFFGCLVGEEFLYWPRREDVNEVYCMSINDHSEGFNIELQARSIYLIHRQRGVEFLEPLPQEGKARIKKDHRLDDFFTKGGTDGGKD